MYIGYIFVPVEHKLVFLEIYCTNGFTPIVVDGFYHSGKCYMVNSLTILSVSTIMIMAATKVQYAVLMGA